MARKPDEHAPNPLDIALGTRVRLRRKEMGMSQDQLARAVGITFQQVQKYEHGTNRISFSRLVEIAEALSCSVADLVGDLDKTKPSASFNRHISFLNEPGASDLLEAYAVIESPKRRRAILNLARQLANDQGEGGRPQMRRTRAHSA